MTVRLYVESKSVSDWIRGVSNPIRMNSSTIWPKRRIGEVKESFTHQAERATISGTPPHASKRSRVSAENEDAADGVERKAVCSALDGHDPGGVRYGRLNTTGDRKPALRHAVMFHASCAWSRVSAGAFAQMREAIAVPWSD